MTRLTIDHGGRSVPVEFEIDDGARSVYWIAQITLAGRKTFPLSGMIFTRGADRIVEGRVVESIRAGIGWLETMESSV